MRHVIVHVNLRGFLLTVEGDFYPAVRGRDYLRNGDPGFPDEEDAFSITKVSPCGSPEDITPFFEDLYFRSHSFKDGHPVFTMALDELEYACIDNIKEES